MMNPADHADAVATWARLLLAVVEGGEHNRELARLDNLRRSRICHEIALNQERKMDNQPTAGSTSKQINKISQISALCSELGAMVEDLDNRLYSAVARLDGERPAATSEEKLAEVDAPGAMAEIERKLHHMRGRLGNAITSINELETLV